MLATLLYGLGMVLILEGLAYALAPSFMKDLMRRMLGEGDETLRTVGFIALICGVGLLIIAEIFGGSAL